MKRIVKIVALLFAVLTFGQNENIELPYYEIPEYAEKYTAGTVAARQVDALGFRFYWATHDLTEKDLAYKLSDSVRTTGETISHIYDLSKIIVNATLKKQNNRGKDTSMRLDEKRAQTLINLKNSGRYFYVRVMIFHNSLSYLGSDKFLFGMLLMVQLLMPLGMLDR